MVMWNFPMSWSVSFSRYYLKRLGSGATQLGFPLVSRTSLDTGTHTGWMNKIRIARISEHPFIFFPKDLKAHKQTWQSA